MHRDRNRVRSLTGCTAASLVLLAAGCGKSGPKPTEADIAAYLASEQPSYLRVAQVQTTVEPVADASKVPAGSWRVRVKFLLHAEQDLYAPTAEARSTRATFDRIVAQTELYRLPRIAAVQLLGKQAGLVAKGATAPEPAVPVSLVNRKGQDMADEVLLLAEPDGKVWKFFQLDAQSLTDDAIGAPLDALQHSSPTTRFVIAGSPEAREAVAREQRFLEVLGKAEKP